MTTRPCKILDAAELEQWAERYAPHQLTAYECSDACEYLDFWEWMDLTHSDVLSYFKFWYGDEHS